MILKVVCENNSTIGAVQVFENDENGELTIHDAHNIKALNEGNDSVFGSNDSEVIVIVNMGKFKQNCLIAADVYHEFKDSPDEDFYRNCMEAICEKIGVTVGPIPERVYEIWSIIEEEYL